jgi:predicted amidohydrolase
MGDETINLALWVANMALSPRGLEDWAETVKGLLRDAAKKGSALLVAPEYISEQWMSFAPKGIKATEEVGWMAAQAQKVLPALQDAVKETGVALLAGTMPWPKEGGNGYTNRAWLLFPDRKAVYHDKLVMTPFEMDPNDWYLETGKTVRIFEWRGVRMAVIICLDVEMPALCNRLAEHHIDLLLVPSMTEKLSGYSRVFGCAKARAIELMTAVAAVGSTGASVSHGAARQGHHGGAAVYIPCEEAFGYTGIHAEIPVANEQAGAGRVLYADAVPVGRIRAIRKGKPEVWPGPWSAGHLDIKEVA